LVEQRLFATVAATTAVSAATAIAAVTTATTAITPVAAAATATAAEAATTAAATTATAVAAPTAATKATATGRTLLAGTRDVDRQGAALDLMSVELFHALLGFLSIRHRHEGESTGTTGKFVEDDLNDTDGSDLAEQGLKVLGGASEGKIPHVELVVF
jgi:hypothetical protein